MTFSLDFDQFCIYILLEFGYLDLRLICWSQDSFAHKKYNNGFRIFTENVFVAQTVIRVAVMMSQQVGHFTESHWTKIYTFWI